MSRRFVDLSICGMGDEATKHLLERDRPIVHTKKSVSRPALRSSSGKVTGQSATSMIVVSRSCQSRSLAATGFTIACFSDEHPGGVEGPDARRLHL